MTGPLRAVRRFRRIATFIGARRADYAELAALEWTALGGSLLAIVCGGVAASLSLLFVLGFVSFAVIVSAWDSDWRVATAWLVAGFWLLICVAGGVVVATVARRLRPFAQVREELGKDVAAVRSAL